MKKFTRSNRGITLIELLSTVVIIGIVASMAVPRFSIAIDRIKFRAANRDLISSLRLARSNAITEKDQYGVYFAPDRRLVILYKDTDAPASYTFSASDSILRVDTLPPQINYLGTDMTGNTILFQPNGSAKFTGGGNVVVLATTEAMVAIETHNILASTGRVESYANYY